MSRWWRSFEGGEAVGGQVVGVPAGHALGAEPMLDQDGRVAADEDQPEVDLADSIVGGSC